VLSRGYEEVISHSVPARWHKDNSPFLFPISPHEMSLCMKRVLGISISDYLSALDFASATKQEKESFHLLLLPSLCSTSLCSFGIEGDAKWFDELMKLKSGFFP